MSTFISERTRIVPFEKSHIPAIVEMYHEPDSNRFIEPLMHMSEAEWIEKLEINAVTNQTELLYWSVYHKESGDFIGTMNLNIFNLSGDEQIGLHLSRKFWGKGYGFELCEAVLDYAFEVKKMPMVHWVFEEDHEVSKKLAEKLGFLPHKEMMDGDILLKIYRRLASA